MDKAYKIPHFKCGKCEQIFKRKYHLKRHSVCHNGASDDLSCKLCGQTFSRIDNLKRHMCNRISKIFGCDKCIKISSRKARLKIHKIKCGKKKNEIDKSLWRKVLLEKTLMCDQMLLDGQFISELLNEDPSLKEESINSSESYALNLYRLKNNTDQFDIDCITLRPWQKDVLEYIRTPTHRQIIFIVGKKGNEGKTFFTELYFTALW